MMTLFCGLAHERSLGNLKSRLGFGDFELFGEAK